MNRAALLTTLLFLAFPHSKGGETASQAPARRAPEYTFSVVHAFPHDPTAFTQGLAWRDGFLYEGTGLKGRSSLRKVRLETGEIVRQIDLAPEFFGEGITFYKDKIIQLTWLSHTDSCTTQAIFVCSASSRTKAKAGVWQPTARRRAKRFS